jgi:uncharacterized LabA/DUF88 family protein
MPIKTIVYIDGYNLYYGVLRRSPYKWLDVYKLFAEQVLDSSITDLVEVRYYTAPILGAMCDDQSSPNRQRSYIQALTKLRNNEVKIIQGKLVASQPKRRPVEPIEGYDLVKIHDFEEKKTDVNIAVDMLADVWTGRCEQIVLCSNDSDQEPALRMIKLHHPNIKIGLVAPVSQDSRHISKDLSKHADWHKMISTVHLEQSQLPAKIPHTSIKKPEQWR